VGILRLLLAVSVILTHSFPLFGYEELDGIMAVEGFFVISGFYMALILNEKYVGTNRSYFLYLSNRLLRIFPAYWLILLVTIIFSAIMFSLGWHNQFDSINPFYHHERATGETLLPYTSIDNVVKDITIIFRTDYFAVPDASRYDLIIQQAWTLVPELLFYIIAPFIVRSLKVVIPLFVVSVLVRYYTFYVLLIQAMPLPQRFFPAELVFFLLGALAYFLYKRVKDIPLRQTSLWALTLLVIIITLTYQYLPKDTQIQWMILKDCYPILLSVTIPFIFLVSKQSTIDRYLGELSYPVYLLHSLVILSLANIPILTANPNIFTMLVILFTIMFSLIIVRYFEQPIEKWRQARVKGASGKKAKSYLPLNHPRQLAH
jgi:peptidoglycan/LPS O-acetylase OafA/YrhL